MPKPEKPEEPIPEVITFSALSGLVGMPAGTARDLLNAIGYPITGKHSTRDGLRALFRAEMQRKGKKSPAEAVAASQMALDAAAMSAMARAEKEGSLVPADMVVRSWEDLIAKASTAVSRLPGIPTATKEKVFAAIRSVGVPSVKDEEA